MIVCIQMNGGFRDEASGMYLIASFHSNYVGLAAQSTENYESHRIHIQDEVLADLRQQVTMMLINYV